MQTGSYLYWINLSMIKDKPFDWRLPWNHQQSHTMSPLWEWGFERTPVSFFCYSECGLLWQKLLRVREWKMGFGEVTIPQTLVFLLKFINFSFLNTPWVVSGHFFISRLLKMWIFIIFASCFYIKANFWNLYCDISWIPPLLTFFNCDEIHII